MALDPELKGRRIRYLPEIMALPTKSVAHVVTTGPIHRHPVNLFLFQIEEQRRTGSAR